MSNVNADAPAFDPAFEFRRRGLPPILPGVSGRSPQRFASSESGGQRVGLARALSKLGLCSRREAHAWIHAGRVSVNGIAQQDPLRWVDLKRDRISVDEQAVAAERKVYLMLNKPRGLVTTTSDERGRPTVFTCLAQTFRVPAACTVGRVSPSAPPQDHRPLAEDSEPYPDGRPTGTALPRVVPVGRLDQASEGVLLFTNDTQWAARLTDPLSHVEKTYHVRVNCPAAQAPIDRLLQGVKDGADFLKAKSCRVLRSGTRNCWLAVVLDEGRNRQIRRLLEALGLTVLRLVRVSVGPLELGALPKGYWRWLNPDEVTALSRIPGKHQ